MNEGTGTTERLPPHPPLRSSGSVHYGGEHVRVERLTMRGDGVVRMADEVCRGGRESTGLDGL